MATIEKTMTEAAQAANQSNGRQSSGPASPEGKERSKMNALKHGKYATRPDPVKLLLAGGYGTDYGSGYGKSYGRAAVHKAEEAATADEAERASLRAEMVRCYAPRDDFARLQAEELADLKFELLRLERVKEVLWRRERELLEIEQRRRHWLLQGGPGIATREWDIGRNGYASLPDSPAKFLGMRSLLSFLVRHAGGEKIQAKAVQRALNYLYGGELQSFCGSRLRDAAATANAAADNPQAAQEARESLKAAASSQLDRVEERLGICLMEEGPLSEAGQAARLLEATNSRKWGWLRSQENFLRRSIDRKVSVLIELRYEDTREALVATRRPGTPDATPGAPNATGNESGSPPAPPPALPEDGRAPAAAPATEGRNATEDRNLIQRSGRCGEADCDGHAAALSGGTVLTLPQGKNTPNRGTNPPCALESTNRYRVRRCQIRESSAEPRPSRVESPELSARGGWLSTLNSRLLTLDWQPSTVNYVLGT
ncbi:MAG TPA: hypothetical protein VGZ29_03820 [Terriglobia bacterium]|nr:hypothetical protein [Terriglobia bacterium]